MSRNTRLTTQPPATDEVDRKAFSRAPTAEDTSLIQISLHVNKNDYRLVEFLTQQQEFTNVSEGMRFLIRDGLQRHYPDIKKEFLNLRVYKEESR